MALHAHCLVASSSIQQKIELKVKLPFKKSLSFK